MPFPRWPIISAILSRDVLLSWLRCAPLWHERTPPSDAAAFTRTVLDCRTLERLDTNDEAEADDADDADDEEEANAILSAASLSHANFSRRKFIIHK